MCRRLSKVKCRCVDVAGLKEMLIHDLNEKRSVAVRECGECTACCEGWLPDESLDMYAGKACAHCRQRGVRFTRLAQKSLVAL